MIGYRNPRETESKDREEVRKDGDDDGKVGGRQDEINYQDRIQRTFGWKNFDQESLLLWKPNPKLREQHILEYIETANLIAELPEDAALGFLLANNYEMRECLENLTKIKHSNGQHNEDKIPAYFQNLIFTEHQLNISKSIFSKDVVDKLFLHYYTKQIRPPSYSEVLMINREEDTSLINLIGQRLNFDNTSPSGVDLGAALSICYENRQNLTFDVTKLDQFKRRRQHIVSIRKNLQKHRQKNHQRLFELKANFADYWKFLYFLRNVRFSLIDLTK
ncbi:hypothetical protein QR98_0100640 [Sarcoptes scabiei]|uniref:Uncharacterized protein n=1 Tax=Sarcoptes scabiei TaxID=52283 RepID=A0A132AKP5_SARSC|nr:hypothetical protein QR98_0100640 [Sarcoptes scabiei]